eukprot:GHVQ01005439.1.p1 GENE.GHVQ01005439.1~~GHVQ01005439.1.p1  ORF type:complete len:113 (+),score=14.83 GHVQ01005439.1:351-689(+)
MKHPGKVTAILKKCRLRKLYIYIYSLLRGGTDSCPSTAAVMVRMLEHLRKDTGTETIKDMHTQGRPTSERDSPVHVRDNTDTQTPTHTEKHPTFTYTYTRKHTFMYRLQHTD